MVANDDLDMGRALVRNKELTMLGMAIERNKARIAATTDSSQRRTWEAKLRRQLRQQDCLLNAPC